MNFAQLFVGLTLLLCIFLPIEAKANLKVVYAINAGSHEHIDKAGIHYYADTLKVGTASDYGNHLMMIGRVPEHDEILYRTERYHTATFGYDLPLDGDGDYALILKFCEVYFNEPNAKVFDVMLNNQHKIISQLDIFHQVGRGTAYDEYVFFTVSKGRLYYKDEKSDIFNNMIRLDFIKGSRDNPKINAFALLKGNIDNLPRLPPLEEDFKEESSLPDHEEEHQHEHEHLPSLSEEETFNKLEAPIEDSDDSEQPMRARKTSGPRVASPYTVDDSSSYMLPVFIAIGAFIPLLFCLCKL